ncbi:alkaline phosphatase D family protein [Yunchengibacter salinarum]|uniref:alkaline phosphatase D family protein n=1 Tax=Yunchengibacter salinarum TaxID=3133399 RepID=UPI0035B61C5D
MSSDIFSINRRAFMGAVGFGTLALSSPGALADRAGRDRPGFSHGVASGDPLQDRVILWTRFVPKKGDNAEVLWEVALDNQFQDLVAEGAETASDRSDFIVKPDVVGLSPGQTYYYRFRAGGVTSPVGRTRTLPDGDVDAIRFGVVSCSNYPQGYFHAYRALAERDIAFVAHLGDYIYEYEAGRYVNPDMVAEGRGVEPKTELFVLDDYRTRYALYRSDTDLQAVHAAHPFICVWDDHEIANDTWTDGAENHQEDEGAFARRRRAAVQAYREWLPIRDPEPGAPFLQIYRSFDLGNLARLIMLDTRLIGRDEQISYEDHMPYRTLPFDMGADGGPRAVLDADALAALPEDRIRHVPVPFDLTGAEPVPVTDWARIQDMKPGDMPRGFSYLPDVARFRSDILGDPDRTLLGQAQEQWLARELQESVASGQPFQIIGQQVLSGHLGIPQIPEDAMDFSRATFLDRQTFGFFMMLARYGLPFNLDAWDGYPAARARLLAAFKAAGATPVMLAGDTHNGWAFSLRPEKSDETTPPTAVEWGTMGVSSPGLESYVPADPALVREKLLAASPELEWMDPTHRGWLEVELTRDGATGHWFGLDSVTAPDSDHRPLATARWNGETHTVTPVDMEGGA